MSQIELLDKLLRTAKWRDAERLAQTLAFARTEKEHFLPVIASSLGIPLSEATLLIELQSSKVSEWWQRRHVTEVAVQGTPIEVDGWIADYINFTVDQEAPPVFHLWIAIYCLSSLLGRHVYLNRGYYTLFPNLFVLLIAPSGSCRRTTASNIGINILKQAKVNILADRVTPEKLPYDLHTEESPDAEGAIYASELSLLLDRKEYNKGLVKLLTNLYDCPDPYSVSTKKDKKILLERTCITMLGTCPPDEFGEALPVEVTTGGFLARCIVLLITEKSKRVFQGKPDYTLHNKLIESAKQIYKMKGEVKYDPFAFEVVEQWYMEMEMPHNEIAESGYYQRKHDHLLKVAIIFNVSRGGNLTLTLYDVLSAKEIMESIEPLLKKAHEMVHVKPTARDQAFILNLFLHRKTVMHSELVRVCRLRMNRREFMDALEALAMGKQIERVKIGKEDYWKRGETK